MAEEMQHDLHHDQLQAVGKALDALLLTVHQLTCRHNEMIQAMDQAVQEVNTHSFFDFP